MFAPRRYFQGILRPHRQPVSKQYQLIRPVAIGVERLEDRTLLSGTPVLTAAYGQLPMSFEINQGQTDRQANFLSRGNGYTLFLTPKEAVINLQHAGKPHSSAAPAPHVIVGMQLIGSDPTAMSVGLDELAAKSNYFIGNDPSQWRTGVSNYGRVEYSGVYPGINLVYYGNQQQLEYDFQVEPAADPSVIRLAFTGAQSLELDGQGNLVLHALGGDVIEHAPVVYQQRGDVRQAVEGHYTLAGTNQVGFTIGKYDPGRALVIDPVLSYSTYLGGEDYDYGYGIAADVGGNAYVTGITQSANFPLANPLQSTGDFTSAFVTKLNAQGTALIYSTYLSGSSGDSEGYAIAVDASGNAYVTGQTGEVDFPTVNPLQAYAGNGDAFVTELNATGSGLVYSTYLGGPNREYGYGIAVDASGNAYVTGEAQANFPTYAALQPSFGGGASDAFVAKLGPAGASLVYSTYLGGGGDDSGDGITVDATGNAYVVGHTNSLNFPLAGALQPTLGGGRDAFAAKLNATGSALSYSTFLGGSGDDAAYGIAVDGAGNAYISGGTGSTNFPTVNPLQSSNAGSFDAFVAKLNASGSALVYSSYLGGSNEDDAHGVGVDSAGNAYIVGITFSTDFPTANPIQAVNGDSGGQTSDAFVAELNTTGSALRYSTYLGGNADEDGNGIAVDPNGNVYITGYTWSANYPTTPGAFQTVTGTVGGHNPIDAFIARIVVPTHIVIQDTGGGASYMVRLKLGDPSTLEVLKNGVVLHSYITFDVTDITFDLTGGDNQLTLDDSNGDPVPAGGLDYEGGPTNTLIVSATADPVSRTITLDTVTQSGSSPFGTIIGQSAGTINYEYAATNNVTLIAGSQADTFNILASASGTGTTINAGAASDTFNVGKANSLDSIQGPITINGGSGSANLARINDQSSSAAHTYTLDGGTGTLTRSGAAPITYMNLKTMVVKGGSGGNTFVVTATPTGTAVTLAGGNGSNTLVGPGGTATTTWTVNSTNGGLLGSKVTFSSFATLVGGSGNDTFKFTAMGAVTSLDGGLGSTNKVDYSGNGGHAVTINLANNSAPQINGGAASGFVRINSFVGSNASDTLIGTNAATTWQISNTNAGKAGTVSFTGIDNLVGGSGGNTFKVSNGKTLSGSINGGSGTNAIDYSAWTTGVKVNLATGAATGIAGGISNFTILTGGAGNDNLTGGAGFDIIRSGAGADTIVGGSGNDILIGGSGTDRITSSSQRSILIADKGVGTTLNGGAAGDILVGGYTSYDPNSSANNKALLAILNEWLSPTDDYATRISKIRAGLTGGYKFSAATVHTVAGDVLNGQANFPNDPDWFWAASAGEITDADGSNEQVN